MWTVEEPPMPYYKYEPQPVLLKSRYKTSYDRSTTTDRAVHNNELDIVMFDTAKEKAYVID
jgi:hypothetical protein